MRKMSHHFSKVYIFSFFIALDLGIDIVKTKSKLLSVITQRGIKENADYDDMAGPLLLCVLFGFFLLCVS